MIVGAGGEGAMDTGNMLKPMLARGEIHVIGATTLNEYRKYIEKDTALERRFQPVMVDEPNHNECVDILKGIKEYYEDYHKVKISDEIINEAVTLSEKYIHDRFLPDKAIDLLDEACARVNLEDLNLAKIEKVQKELDEAIEEETQIQEEMAKQSETNAESTDNSVFERAAKNKEIKCKLKTTLDELIAN